MKKEEQIRERVHALQQFYLDGITYVLVNALLFLIWLIFDTSGTFWPKYVLLVWGIALAFKAYRMGIMDLFLTHVSFLTPEWEERKVRELKKHPSSLHKIPLGRDGKQ